MQNSSNQIEVVVIYDSRIQKCEAACGLDWSTNETVDVMSRRIEERFGKTVRLKIINLAVMKSGNAVINKQLASGKLTLPILLINNELRISGEFDARQLLDAIEVERELKWKTNMM